MRRMGIGLGVGINRSNYAQGIFGAYATRVVADGGVVEAGACVDAVSGLLLSASLLLVPSGYKGGKLYAEIPTNGNGDLTWTRGSDAFRTNASGLIQRVPWNLFQRSEEFANAYWTKANTSITANTITAPNGTLTADTIIENTANGFHSMYVYYTSSSSQSYNITIYAKAKERNFVYIFTSSGTAFTYFNVLNGTIGNTAVGHTATITDVGDGWYRCSVSFTQSGASDIGYGITTANGVNSYTGNGTSGLYFWGAQLVEGTTAQTYLPTTDRLNFPRLSYMYGSCPAVLVEPQRTNLALQSETFDNASWTKSASSVTANSTTSPDGNTTADTFLGDGTSTIHQVFQNISATSGVGYTFSVYAKKNTNNFLQLTGASGLFGINSWANFDLNNGVVGSVGSSTTASIVNAGNGWYRCIVTITATATTTNNILLLLVTSATSVRAESNTLSTSVFLWGAQLEAGAYPTTYISTTSATATRVADSFSRSNIYTNGLISASGGTWFVELRGNVSYTRDTFAIEGVSLLNSGTTDGFIFTGGIPSRLQIRKYVGSALSTLYTTTTDTVKIAIKWNGSTADIFENGTKVVSATAFTATTSLELLKANGTDVPKFIQQMALFPTPLTDTQCQTLTTL